MTRDAVFGTLSIKNTPQRETSADRYLQFTQSENAEFTTLKISAAIIALTKVCLVRILEETG